MTRTFETDVSFLLFLFLSCHAHSHSHLGRIIVADIEPAVVRVQCLQLFREFFPATFA
jgi:hypothetical protein